MEKDLKAAAAVEKKPYVLKVDYGCDKKGKPRHPKGSEIKLTEAQQIRFKNLNII